MKKTPVKLCDYIKEYKYSIEIKWNIGGPYPPQLQDAKKVFDALQTYSFKYKRAFTLSDDDLQPFLKILILSPQYIYYFCYYIIGCRWPEAEKNICKTKSWARMYCNVFFRNHFPEDEIETNPLYDIWYNTKIKEIFGYEEKSSKIM